MELVLVEVSRCNGCYFVQVCLDGRPHSLLVGKADVETRSQRDLTASVIDDVSRLEALELGSYDVTVERRTP
jgi:hypothetical protein